MIDFVGFPKMGRLSREMIITEKIDGTNAQVVVTEEGDVLACSRTRFITPEDDNFGFARWVEENKECLKGLGVGRHFGEWWGQGIQRKYGLDHKKFSLFNPTRWAEDRPECCDVVPVLYTGMFDTLAVEEVLFKLGRDGSVAAPSFMNPEGIVVYHTAARVGFKKTLEKDEVPKGSWKK